jgi:hypothetical protein
MVHAPSSMDYLLNCQIVKLLMADQYFLLAQLDKTLKTINGVNNGKNGKQKNTCTRQI